MSSKEINLESQISEQDQKISGSLFSVRKIAIGLTGFVFVAACGLTYAYKDQLFGSNSDQAAPTVGISSALPVPAPATSNSNLPLSSVPNNENSGTKQVPEGKDENEIKVNPGNMDAQPVPEAKDKN